MFDYSSLSQENGVSYVANAILGRGAQVVDGHAAQLDSLDLSPPLVDLDGVEGRGLGRSPSLVLNTEIAVKSRDLAAIAARLEPWKLLSLARELLPERRVSWCFRRRITRDRDVDLYHNPERDSFRIGNLARCGMPQVCPCCARVEGERVRGELAQAVSWGRDHGYEILFGTYTAAHGRGDALLDTLDAVTKAYRSMTRDQAYRRLCKAYSVEHVIRGLEVTFGGWNGAHPHFHALHFARSGGDWQAYQEKLAPIWVGALGDYGFKASFDRGARIEVSHDKVAAYIAKWDKPPQRRPWEAVDELGKPNSKHGHGEHRLTPFDLLRKIYYGRQALEELEGRAAAKVRHHIGNCERWFKEYDQAVYHRHRLQYSRGLRAAAGLPCAASVDALAQAEADRSARVASLSVDEWLDDSAYAAALAEEDKPSSTEVWLASVPLSDWLVIDRYHLQGELLEALRRGGVEGARAFVTQAQARGDHYGA